ncbi:hypothetical protein KEM09_05075 [Carboxylicivirga mesophila]|uniref:Fibrobacter succinogenes major paralogous domain-containing protein n=1 Tax=Carboxylicivirga mesophila TaxID=1166478 RepID=A0ABS5K887_9BACT|nr:FISUMP domain-containing protein [Carboxylicivirga mesophila]MBS2210758.1 hypothetical protein [Carboxylicivirga mesophila]
MKQTIIGTLLLLSIALLHIGCNKDQEPVILNPDAGGDILNVENEGYVVGLNAVPAPEGQEGSWRIYMGENGHFDDENDPKTNFYGEPGERYLIGWELSERGQYEAATINVSFKPLNPVILNTVSDTVYNNISVYLEAEAPRFGATGVWSIISGTDARIINDMEGEAEFIGVKHQDYTVRWTLSYGSKSVSKDMVFTTDELKAFAGLDNLDIKTAKGVPKFFTLEGFLPAGATGKWEVIGGQNGIVHTPAIDNSLFEGVVDTVYTLAWTVELDGIQSVDTVDLRFRGKWGMWTDERDGQTYRFTEVNGLEWMAENYNYAAEPGYGSWYYGQDARSIIEDGYALETEEDRKYYGRLYDWHTAYNYAPEGWRLPSSEEFNNMLVALGGALYADERIKEGGDTGLDLGFAGYYNIASPSDPAFRNAFIGQDMSGLYWLNEYYDYNGRGTVFEVTSSSDTPGMGSLPVDFFKVSVRYVRDIQD